MASRLRALGQLLRRVSRTLAASADAPRNAQLYPPLRSLAALAAGGLAAGGTAWAAASPPAAPDPPAAAAPPAASNDATAQWRVLTDVGRDLARQGRHADAESFFVRAVDAARRGFGPDDPHVASACQNLAELYRVQRRYEEAAPLYESALAVLAEAYGAADVRVAFALHNVAGLYFSQRRYDLAAERYEQALQIKCATLGPGHSETTNTAWHLAEVCWAAGRKAEGTRLAIQALDAMEQQGGAMEACARRRARVGEVLVAQGRYAEAEPLLRRNLEQAEAMQQGGGGARTAAAAEALAAALQGQRRWDEARKLLQRAVAERRSHAGPRHPATAAALRHAAELEVAVLATVGGGGRPAEVAQVQLQAAQTSSEAVTIAEQAYSDVAAAGGGGAQGWLAKTWDGWRRAAGTQLQRAASPEVAALELARCLLVQAQVQLALNEAQQAMEALQRALGLLADKSAAATEVPHAGAASEKLEALRRQALCGVLTAMLAATERVHGALSVEAASVKAQLATQKCSAPSEAAPS